jgi:hypothetical protein
MFAETIFLNRDGVKSTSTVPVIPKNHHPVCGTISSASIRNPTSKRFGSAGKVLFGGPLATVSTSVMKKLSTAGEHFGHYFGS